MVNEKTGNANGLAMTDEEIVKSWRNAVSAKKQVGILAELNDCLPSRIVEILYKAGVLSGQAIYQYRKSGMLPSAGEEDAESEFEKKVARAGTKSETKVFGTRPRSAEREERRKEMLDELFGKAERELSGEAEGEGEAEASAQRKGTTAAEEQFEKERKERAKVLNVFSDNTESVEEKQARIEAEETEAELPPMPESVRGMIEERIGELRRSIGLIEKQIDDLTADRNGCLEEIAELKEFFGRWVKE